MTQTGVGKREKAAHSTGKATSCRPPTVPKQTGRFTAEFALLVVCLIWGCNFAVMKSALVELHPFAFNAIRITMSAGVLGAWHCASRNRRGPLPRGTWPKIFGLGLIGYFGYQVCFLTGLARTESGHSALILSSSPIFTVLIGVMLGERLRRRAWIGLAIALAGTVVIALEKAFGPGSQHLAGTVLTFGAACAWGSYTALNRGVARIVPPATLAFYTTVITLPLHWALGFQHLDSLWRFEISAHAWSAMTYSGLLGTGLAYALWNVGLDKVGAVHTAGFINLVPVIALATGWLALHERVSWIQIAGGAAVLVGVWNMHRARHQRTGSGSKSAPTAG